MKTFQEICSSKTMKVSAITIGILVITCVSFAGGIAVGLHKAKFSYAFGENYERNFIHGKQFNRDARGEFGVMMRGDEEMMRGWDLNGRGFRNGHGVTGEVLSVSDASIIIKDQDGKENTLTILPTTIVKNGNNTIPVSDLTAGTQIVVIGKPSDTGTINADFIRVFSATNANQ